MRSCELLQYARSSACRSFKFASACIQASATGFRWNCGLRNPWVRTVGSLMPTMSALPVINPLHHGNGSNELHHYPQIARIWANTQGRRQTVAHYENARGRETLRVVGRGNWRRGSESNRRPRLCRPLHDHSATPPGVGREARVKRASRKQTGELGGLSRESGAGNESRTRDLNLGKVALYQLSYSRGGVQL